MQVRTCTYLCQGDGYLLLSAYLRATHVSYIHRYVCIYIRTCDSAPSLLTSVQGSALHVGSGRLRPPWARSSLQGCMAHASLTGKTLGWMQAPSATRIVRTGVTSWTHSKSRDRNPGPQLTEQSLQAPARHLRIKGDLDDRRG